MVVLLNEWWVVMVTLHELDFPSLRVTVLQTADGGTTHLNFGDPDGIRTRDLMRDRHAH
jgi:hypothetical protein